MLCVSFRQYARGYRQPPGPYKAPAAATDLIARARCQSSQVSLIPGDEVGLSDSALSRQLTTLEAAGYVEIRKGFAGKWPRTSARPSNAARAAFKLHVAALQEIVGRAGASLPEPG